MIKLLLAGCFSLIAFSSALAQSGNAGIDFGLGTMSVSGAGLGSGPNILPSTTGTTFITVGSSPANSSFTVTNSVLAQYGYNCFGSDVTTPTITFRLIGYTVNTAVLQAYNSSGATTSFNANDTLSITCGKL